MKKLLVTILAFSALACTSESLEDSSQSNLPSSKSELTYTSRSSRPSSWAKKMTSRSFDNLYKVNDDIYRSEQPTQEGFNSLERRGIVSILNLREGHKDHIQETTYSGHLYNVPMDTLTVSDTEIIKALRIIDTAPKPMDIHCLHGSDRTGVTIAMYRIVFEDWSKEDAIEEMTDGGYHFHSQYTNLIDYIRDADVDYIKDQVFY